MNVGANVEKYRKAAGMTQQELADKIDVTQASIARLEKNVRLLSFANMCRIAKELGVSAEELLGEKRAKGGYAYDKYNVGE